MTTIQEGLFIQGFGAFFGAFFAFIFLRLTSLFQKIYERQIKHYNSIIKLGNQLNELGGIIYDGLYLIPEFRKVIVSGNIYFNNLHLLPIDKSHYLNLYDLDLINKLFDFNYKIRKLNDDIETLTLGYQEIKLAYIKKDIDRDQYILNTTGIADNLKIIEAFLVSLQEETVILLAEVRLKIKKDIPFLTNLLFLFIKPSKINRKDIDNELIKINQELEETKTTSQKEIEKILKENNLIKGGEK